MTFKEFDKLVFNSLKNKWGKKVERRDYRELEREKPDFFKGRSKSTGLMFLVDVTYDLYVDVNLFEDYFKLTFRKDDDNLIKIDSRKHGINDFIGGDKLLYIFLQLIDEYLYLEQRLNLFSSGKIPTDLERANKIDSIMKKSPGI